MPENIKLSALTESTDEQMRDGALMLNSVIDGGSSTGFTSKKTTLSRFANYILNKFAGLSLAGENQTVKDAIDGIKEEKADKSGYYADMHVGTADQVLSDAYTIDRTPYKFRRSPYTDRLSESIVGASVAWNQLTTAVKVASEAYGITRTAITGDKLGLHYSGTSTNSTNFAATQFVTVSGHKYFCTLGATLPTGCRINIQSVDKASEGMLQASGSSITFGVVITSGTTVDLDTYPQAFDLTAMFGSTVANALYNMGDDGIKLFRSWYPKAYYPYSAPTMEHVSGLEAHEMVGFNQWDGTYEAGKGILADGSVVSRVGRNLSDYIRVIPNTAYYLLNVLTGRTGISYALYDADKTFITTGGPVGPVGSDVVSFEVTTPSNCCYARIVIPDSALTSACISISSDKNGTYKPYSKHSYALDASLTLRGLLKYDATKGFYADGDVYKSDGTVERRYGIIDLGTLSWSYNASNAQFYVALSGVKTGLLYVPFFCAKYPTASARGSSNVSDKMVGCGTSGGLSNTTLIIMDSSYTDAASFKSAMSGTMLVYEKSTVETEEAEPYDAIQITDGTEEYVTDCLAPVGHESKYYENLRSKIEGLPTDFSAIICATEATNKASRNYAVGDYLIYNNTLYKVTTAIATNATLTVGTNITATTIMAEIKALQ